MKQDISNTEPIPEIYKLPIIVTEWDLEYEKTYLEFYNDEYWKEYKKQKMKRLKQGTDKANI